MFSVCLVFIGVLDTGNLRPTDMLIRSCVQSSSRLDYTIFKLAAMRNFLAEKLDLDGVSMDTSAIDDSM